MPLTSELERVRDFWQTAPCGTNDVRAIADERERFRELERMRDAREPFIARFARFSDTRGSNLLEVGVGAGTDHVRFARAGARCHGVDLTPAAVELTKRRVETEGLKSDLRVANAELLPFPDASFDVVYSWGVIHHTPDTRRSAKEILRVLRPGGRFCVMVYNRHSLVALQAWIRFGLLRGKPFTSRAELIARHVESPGTKAYSSSEAAALFAGAAKVSVETVVTAYDLRLGRRFFLPHWTWRFTPSRLGWFHVVEGVR